MKKKYWIETVVFLTYAVFAASWVAGSMMTPLIMDEFNVEGVVAATWTTNAITLAKVIGNLLAAWVMIKLNPQKAFAFASLLIVCGAIGAFATSYPLYVMARLLVGFGGALVIVYFHPVVFHYFSAAERPLVNGFNSISFNTGNLAALLLTGLMLQVLGSWRAVTIAVALISLALLLAWWFLSDDFPLSASGKGAETEDKDEYTFIQALKSPVNWFLPIGYSGTLFCYIAIFALFPIIPGFAVPGKNLSATMIATGVVGIIISIVLSRYYFLRVPIIRYCGLAVTIFAAIMIFTTSPALAYIAAFLMGLGLFVPLVSLYTLPQELPGMNPHRVTVVFSIFWSLSYILETIMMAGAGLVADYSGDKFMAAVFVVACSGTTFIFSFFLPETGAKRQQRYSK